MPSSCLQSLSRRDRFEQVRAVLGRPAISENDVLVYQGDCVDLMSRLPPGTFDLTVTSPPYNIGKEYETNMPVAEYVAWTGRWTESLHRIISPQGAFWLNIGYMPVPGRGKAVPIPYLIWDTVPFFLIQEVVWNYGAGVAARHSFSPRNEKWLWYVQDPSHYTFNLDAVRDTNVKYPNQMEASRAHTDAPGGHTDVSNDQNVNPPLGLPGQAVAAAHLPR